MQTRRIHLATLTKTAARHPLRFAYGVSFAIHGMIVWWLNSVKLDDPHIPASLSPILAISFYSLCVAVCAVGPVIFLVLYRRTGRTLSRPSDILIVPLLWIVSEFLRSVLTSLALAGPGASVGDYWMFGHLGLWASATPLVFAARIGGIYLLSGLVVAGAIATYQLIRYQRRWRFVATLVLLIGLPWIGWLSYASTNGPEITVGAIQIDTPEAEVRQNSVLKIVRTMPSHAYDAVILPEYSSYWASLPAEASEEMSRVLKNPEGLVAHSVFSTEKQHNFNTLQYTDAHGLPMAEYRKTFLIPGGEYVPYVYQTGLLISGQKKLLESYIRSSVITKGKTAELPYSFKGTSYGILVCSGANNTSAYRAVTNRGAMALGNAASVRALGRSPLYFTESSLFARFHAVANARPFVQSARGGYSYAFDSNGRKLVTSSLNQGFVTARLRTNSHRTLFTRAGEWILYVAFCVTGVLIVPPKRRQAFTIMLKRLQSKHNYKP